jgi:hypothetical protein
LQAKAAAVLVPADTSVDELPELLKQLRQDRYQSFLGLAAARSFFVRCTGSLSIAGMM